MGGGGKGKDNNKKKLKVKVKVQQLIFQISKEIKMRWVGDEQMSSWIFEEKRS